jgi:hypothetical protein
VKQILVWRGLKVKSLLEIDFYPFALVQTFDFLKVIEK